MGCPSSGRAPVDHVCVKLDGPSVAPDPTLPPGPEKEAALLRIRQAEAAAELDEWASSEARLMVQMSDVVSLREKVAKAESTTK